jgi:hypothetical protein
MLRTLTSRLNLKQKISFSLDKKSVQLTSNIYASNMHIWLRDEVKPFEQRSPLTPETASVLLKEGYKVTVEKSKTRFGGNFLKEEFLETKNLKKLVVTWQNQIHGQKHQKMQLSLV